MDATHKIREDFEKLKASLAKLSSDREAIDAKIRDVRSKMSELEAALRVIERYEDDARLVGFMFGTPMSKNPTVEDMISWALRSLPGERVGALIKEAEKHYGTEINPKSAGNALWYMKKRGEARRDGQNWYPVSKEEAPSDQNGAP